MNARLKKWCLRLLLAPFFAILLYALLVMVAALIPLSGSLNAQDTPPESPETTVYLVSNGVHLNLVLPTHHAVFDWAALLPQAVQPQHAYTYIGWGSEVFYTQVPEWSDLTAPLAWQALSGDRAALFIRSSALPPDSRDTEHVRSFRLPESVYQQLVADIRAQLQDTRALTGQRYFYPAKGRYSPWLTCNEWMRQRLHHIGLPVPLWSPFDRPILWHLPNKPLNH